MIDLSQQMIKMQLYFMDDAIAFFGNQRQTVVEKVYF